MILFLQLSFGFFFVSSKLFRRYLILLLMILIILCAYTLKFANSLENLIFQKKPPKVFFKTRFFKEFRKIQRKTPCQSLFFNKVAGLSLQLY